MQEINVQTHTAFVIYPGLNHFLAQSAANSPIECSEAVIHLVALDPCIHQELSRRLAPRGVEVVSFASAAEYLLFARPHSSACLILDMDLPDHTALDLQRRLAEKASPPPIILICGSCDIPSTVAAMKAGAIEFLTKPIDPLALNAAIQLAFTIDRRQRHKKAESESLRERYSQLTPRERQVFPLVTGGLLNKQAASVLGISEVTLQTHRSRVMEKMKATSFAELVRIAVKLRIPHPANTRQKPALQAQQICSPGKTSGAPSPPRGIFS